MNKTLLAIITLFLFNLFMTGVAHAQCPIGNNNGFENRVPRMPFRGMIFANQDLIDGWRTTAPDGFIEIWSSGFLGVNAYEGNQFAELNAHTTSTLIKYFNAVAGRKITLSFAHRGRQGVDQMRVSIVPRGGVVTYLTNPLTGTEIFSDGTVWRKYGIEYVPPTTGPYEMRFEAYKTASGDKSVGNFLDAVSPIAAPIIVRLNPTIVSCDDNKVRIDGSGSTEADFISYKWFKDGVEIPAVNNLGVEFITDKIIEVTQEGVYTMMGTDLDYGCTGSDSYELKRFRPRVKITYPPIVGSCDPDVPVAPIFPTVDIFPEMPLFKLGVFSCDQPGLVIDPSTGAVDVENSKAGVYQVKFTVPSAKFCSEIIIDDIVVNINTPFTPSIKAGVLGNCDGASAVLSAETEVDQKYVYQWFLDGVDLNQNQNQKDIVATKEGLYRVILTNELGCSKAVQYNLSRASFADFKLDKTQICFGESISIHQIAQDHVASWTWETSDGFKKTGGGDFNYTFKTVGEHWVRLTITSDVTNCAEEKTLGVNVLSVPINPRIKGGVLGECEGSSTVLTAETDQLDEFIYTWFRNGVVLAEKTAAITVSEAGNYEVVLSTLAGCSVRTSSFELKPLPNPNLKIEENVTCDGGTIKAVYDKTGFSKLIWYKKQNDIWSQITENEDILVVNQPGVYKVVVENQASCFYSAETKISIKPDVDFSYSSAKVCLGQSVKIQSIPDEHIERWVWELSDGSKFEGSKSFDYEFKTLGKHWVKLTGYTQGNVCFDEKIVRIEVIAVPKASFSINHSENLMIGDRVSITNLSSIEGNQWDNMKFSWDFGDGETSSERNPDTHVYQKSGFYEVRLTVVNELGCSDTFVQQVKIHGFPKANFVLGKSSYCIDDKVAITNISTTDFNPIVKMEWFFDFGVNTDLDRVENSDAGIGQTQLIQYPRQITASRMVLVKLVVHAFTGHTDVVEKWVQLLPRPRLVFDPIDPLCINSPSVQLKIEELNGLQGVGTFYGLGVSADGIFKPSLAEVGPNLISYTFLPNDGCPSTITQKIRVESLPMAFMPEKIIVFEKEDYQIKPDYRGNIKSYHWIDADGKEWFNEPFPVVNLDHDVDLKLVLENEAGCVSEREVKIIAYKEIIVRSAFSPNNDGINDAWEIPNLKKYGTMSLLKIYNRNGQLVFECHGYDTPWTGAMNGVPLPLGTYFYVITKQLGQKTFAGSVSIIK